jgi:hypothetical protein
MSTEKPTLDELITEYIELADAAPDEPDESLDRRRAEIFQQIHAMGGIEHLEMRL